MSADATIVVIITRTKQKLKQIGAISEESAKTPKELGLNEEWLKMSQHAGVTATKDSRYYLKENKEKL
jgi:hypothetical protein